MKNLHLNQTILLGLLLLMLPLVSIGQRPGMPVNPNLQPVAALDNTFRQISTGQGGKISMKLVEQKGQSNMSVVRKILNSAMCLSKDEVNGQLFEEFIDLGNTFDNSSMSKIERLRPGMILSAKDYLHSGEINYLHRNNRNPIYLNVSGSAIQSQRLINPNDPNLFEPTLNKAVDLLKSNNNFNVTPSTYEQIDAFETTSSEILNLKIGASGHYLFGQAKLNFETQSDSYRYKYVFTYEQKSFTIKAEKVNTDLHLLTNSSLATPEALLISEVIYGRKIHVVVESQEDLLKIDSEFNGSMNLGVLSAKISGSIKYSSLKTAVRVSAYSMGASLAGFDPNDIDASVRHLMSQPYNNSAVPIAFKLVNLQEKSVYLQTVSNIDEKNCISNSKVRFRIKSITLDKANNESRKIYGEIAFNLTLNGQRMRLNGHTGNNQTSFKIPLYSQANPLQLNVGESFTPSFHDQNTYRDIMLNNLDLKIQVTPEIFRQRNLDSDKQLHSAGIMNRTIRQMLTNGTAEQTFKLTFNDTTVELIVELVLI